MAQFLYGLIFVNFKMKGEYADALNEAKLRLDEVTGKTKKIAFDSEAAAKQIGYTRGDREGLITNSSLLSKD